MPIYIAQNPKDHSIDPNDAKKMFSELDPTAFEYRIARVLNNHISRNYQLKLIGVEIANNLR